MNKIWKLRWIISAILAIITIIIVIFSTLNLFLLLIVPVIWTPIFFIFEFMVIPRFKEIEEKERKKESEIKKYDPIRKITELLTNYEDIEDDDELTEIEVTQELGQLIPKLVVIGFRYKDDNTLFDNNFEIHVTDFPVIHQFLIRRLQLGKEINPNEVYYSKKYIFDSNVKVLNDFIDYLKKKVENR